jgi:hypothetical protein
MALHDYELCVDSDVRERISLIIPSVNPGDTFGGVATAIDIFLELGRQTGADLRILQDQRGTGVDNSVVKRRAQEIGLNASQIEIVPRTAPVPRIPTRSTDVFISFNWWGTLNLRHLLRKQSEHFGINPRPYLHLIQEYEPLFYPFSSTHMYARLAFENRWPCWGIFNSKELYDYFVAQGHRMERSFVFEPRLSSSLRPFLKGEVPKKVRRILVYGRPYIARNCFPAVENGLRAWVARNPRFSDWEIVSAGMPHPSVQIGAGRVIKSLGKLSMEEYGQLMRTSAVGLSLMSSPHPSYPPLEMAHFGLRTITNKYSNKDLGNSHDNIISIDDIAPDTIAEALEEACRDFEHRPDAGWGSQTRRPSFLEAGQFEFVEDLAKQLREEVWNR